MGDCAAGYADCDADSATGCEVSLGSDADCATCGDDCTDDYANAAGACVAGACSMGDCQAGFGDCDQVAATGCEAALNTTDHCGACETACAAGEFCIDDGSGWICSSDCPDADADGYADSACGGNDCDDSNATVHPGASEVCGDGIDQNCNALTDEGCDEIPPDDPGGCGCAATRSPAGGPLSLLVLLGLAWLTRRRSQR
jgi:MYXO-CTERM domain-containing protein